MPEGSRVPAQPVDASVAAILSFLLQYLQESCQGIAVSGGGETSHRLGAHGGQLELAAQLADALKPTPEQESIFRCSDQPARRLCAVRLQLGQVGEFKAASWTLASGCQ